MIGLLLATQLAFVPVEPCRVMDTRVKSPITCPEGLPCTHTISSVREFIVAGDESREARRDRGFPHEFSFGFKDQGGEPNGCGVPRDAKAVVLNIAVSSIHTGQGHVRMWPFGIMGYLPFGDIPVPTLPPTASVLNWPSNHCKEWSPGGSHCKPGSENWYTNSVTVRICDPKTAMDGDCNGDLLVQAYGGAIRLVVDVYGYYQEIDD